MISSQCTGVCPRGPSYNSSLYSTPGLATSFEDCWTVGLGLRYFLGVSATFSLGVGRGATGESWLQPRLKLTRGGVWRNCVAEHSPPRVFYHPSHFRPSYLEIINTHFQVFMYQFSKHIDINVKRQETVFRP